MITVIGFDADDTLWHNEPLFSAAKEELQRLLAEYTDEARLEAELYQTEMRNLEHFGYGIKGFALSMIETAIQLTDGRIDGAAIHRIIDLSREMLSAPIQLLDHVEETIPRLAESFDLMIVTKGDLFDQESKIARSGLGDHFSRVEIVSRKDPTTYNILLRRHGVHPERFVMVGDSLRSDVLPVRQIGGVAVHIPYPITWAHEAVPEHLTREVDYVRLDHLGQLPAWLDEFHGSAQIS